MTSERLSLLDNININILAIILISCEMSPPPQKKKFKKVSEFDNVDHILLILYTF